MRRLNATPSA